MADEIVEPTPDATPEPTTTPEPEVAPVTPPAAEGEPLPAEEVKQTRYQRRIDQLTRRNADLQRELDTRSRPTEPAVQTVDHEPQETDFTDYGQFLKALTKYEIRQGQAESAREAVTRHQQEQSAELSRNFEPQLQAARVKYEDFDEVVAQPIYSQATQEMLLQSPQGAEIAYFLGTNPQEALKLSQLSPVAVAREIVKMETRFTMQPKTVSAAPAPITPITGSAPSTKEPSKMTTVEWMAWDRQQRVERLKVRPF